ncbi:MAG: YihA family ribosome biogenesis GTP-binding protein [Bacteroidetes bacterium]|nr:YihA family ribosome biogenesis GTP-binding protein [Bacteroidota bacterium]
MFAKIYFERSVYRLIDLPKKSLPEVILCGRSNVGKSSFINSIFNRKNLARISSTPGKTRSINYYNIDEKFYLVDLPGFGYAKVSKVEREKWGRLVSEFVRNAKNIELAIHFIDSRHKPTEVDINLNELLKFANIPYLVLLSKSDKLKQSDFKIAINNITSTFPELILDENLFFYSTIKGRGKKEIINRLSKLFYLR